MRRGKQKRLALDAARKAPILDCACSVATQIAKGQLTRERTCDGKARFTTYDYAERVGREEGPKHNSTFRVYACPFCDGYHLATEGAA
jgi:hypothetical protein